MPRTTTTRIPARGPEPERLTIHDKIALVYADPELARAVRETVRRAPKLSDRRKALIGRTLKSQPPC